MATANDLTSRAAAVLNDPGNANWSAADLLVYLNDGLQLMVLRVPEQFATVQDIVLVAGAKQALPAPSALLLNVLKVASGRTPRLVDRAALDAFSPSWQAAAQGETREWAYNPKDPFVFWVSPPAVAAAALTIETADYPAVLAGGSTVPVDDAYHPALVDYVVYRALSKDADYAADDNRAGFFYTRWVEATGGDASESGG